MYVIFFDLAQTTSHTDTLLSRNKFLKINRQRLFNRFLSTALPYFVEIENPINDCGPTQYLKERPFTENVWWLFKSFANWDVVSEKFNYAEIVSRPFFLRRAKIERPAFVLMRFINPCLFLRFLFENLIVVFILCPFYLKIA